jgi:hypothetical protein
VTWGSSGENAELFDDPSAEPVNYDLTPLDELFLPPAPPPSGTSGDSSSTEGGL